MEQAVVTMEAQLRVWGLEIDTLVAKTQLPGSRAGFESLMYIDELKALHAVALANLLEFKASSGARRARLGAELKLAWRDLDAAFKRRLP